MRYPPEVPRAARRAPAPAPGLAAAPAPGLAARHATPDIAPSRRVLPPALALAGFAAAILAAGCLTALAPAIRPVAHHDHLRPADRRDACLACHDLESAMAARMAAMPSAARADHAAAMMDGGGAPLVADWMADDPRECLECHRLRRPWGQRP